MLTKGAIGNLINRYRAVLQKCSLINTFGSLAIASMLVLGGAGAAMAGVAPATLTENQTFEYSSGKAIWNGTTSQLIGLDSEYSATLKGSGDKAKKDYAIEVTGGTHSIDLDALTIQGTGSNSIFMHDNSGAAVLTIKAKAVEISDNKYGNLIQNNGGTVKIEADSLTLDTALASVAEAGAGTRVIRAHKGDVEIKVKDLTISDTAGDSIKATGGARVDITATGVAQIKSGFRAFGSASAINLAITGSDSYVEGGFSTEVLPDEEAKYGTGAGAINITLSDKAKWITGDDREDASTTVKSDVASISLDDGIIEMTPGHDVAVGTLDGSGTVIFTDNSTSTLTVETDNVDALTVTTEKNADEISTADLAKVAEQVAGVDGAKITATAAAGIVNDAVSMVDGKVKSGGGASPVTKALLENASVTSVALDKILTNDVRKRLGDIRSDANTTGVWMRWDGGKLKGNSGLSNSFNTIQIGGDTKVAKNCRVGVAGSFTHGDTDFARGSGELEGFSFAAYATWMGENGMFADVVARLGKFSNELNVAGLSGDMDNNVYSLSGEYGWRFNVSEQFFVEPQVELAYTYVSSDDLQLGDAKFDFDNVDSLTGRAGIVAGWKLPDDRGNVYARASVVQQFMGDAKVTGYTGVGATVHKTDGDDTWLEYGIGANIRLNDSTYLWADVERTEGASVEEEWRGTIGVRFSF